jgi:hypothetical protein
MMSDETDVATVTLLKAYVLWLQFTGSQESILHMDIEDVGTLGSDVNNDTDRLQQRNVRTVFQIQPLEHQVCQLLKS